MNVLIPCPCPPKADGEPRHETDTVVLRDKLNFRTRLALRQTIRWAKEVDDEITDGEALATLTEAYCLHCIESWSIVDDKGKAYPPSRANIRSFLEDHDDGAMQVADAADDLYSKVVLLPLLQGASRSSPDMPIEPSTSPTSGGPTPRKRSKRSSTSTTQTGDTEGTQWSPGGAYSSSPS